MRRHAVRSLLVGTAVTLALAVTGAASAVTTTVRDVHVTQGTQTFGWWAGNTSGFAPQAGNTIPLVSGRSTAVRVSADFGLGPGEALPQGATGRISVTIAGQVVVDSSSAFTINAPWNPPATPRPDVNENDTLNFEFPAGTLRLPAGTTSGTAQFTVLLIAANGSVLGGGSASLEMRLLPKPEIIPVGVRYTPFSSAGPNAAFAALGVADAFMTAALPIDDSCETPAGAPGRCAYRPFGLVQEQAFALDVNGNGLLDSDVDPSPSVTDSREKSGLIEALITVRAVLVYVIGGGTLFGALSGAPPEDVYVYGWVPDGALAGHGGAARVGGDNVGYGVDAPAFGPVAFAHELVHMHDIVPPSASGDFHNDPSPQGLLPALGWDVGGRLIGNPAGTGVGRLRGAGFFDVLGDDVGRTIANGWLGADNYTRMLEERSELQLSTAARRLAGRTPSSRRTVTVIGSVTAFTRERDGTLRATAAELRPTFAIPGARERLGRARSETAHVLVELVFLDGDELRRLLVPVDARTVTNTHLPPPEPAVPHGDGVFLGPFSVTVEAPGPLVRVRLRNRQGRLLAEQRRTKSPPRLTITSPRPRTALQRRTVVRWRVADLDTPAAAMRYHASFSPDGRTFLPIAVSFRGSGIAFDARRLPCTTRGILRVHVSDGVNSATADLRGLVNTRCSDMLRRALG